MTQRKQTGEQFQEGGFSRAIGSDNDEKGPGRNLKVKILDSAVSVESVTEMVYMDGRDHHVRLFLSFAQQKNKQRRTDHGSDHANGDLSLGR